MAATAVTLEWFGGTTYRLRAAGLILYLDAWLDKPETFRQYITLAKAIEDGADYIFISHAHFDHLPGAAKLAKATGAIIVGNCEAISLCRAAGVPDSQLIRVSGGEKLPLFSKSTLEAASLKKTDLAPDLPNASPRPHPKLAAMTVQVWPGLHCLLPNAPAVFLPDELDTGAVPETPLDPAAAKFACTTDITRMMQYGLLDMADLILDLAQADQHTRALIDWLTAHKDPTEGGFSACDGGNLIYNLLMPTPSAGGTKSLLWNAQLGYYPGILASITPRPDFCILSVAGQGNLNGNPVAYSAAEFVVEELKKLGEPERVMWCLWDELPIKPYRVFIEGEDGTRVTDLVTKETKCQVVSVKHAQVYTVW